MSDTHLRRARPWAVIPAKSLHEGKSRLAPVLGAEGRAALNRDFLARTVAVVRDVAGLAGVVVVSADEDALALARELGAHTLPEEAPHDLNRALTSAGRWAAAQGATHVMTVSTDLPHLALADLTTLLDLAMAGTVPGVVIAPDRTGQGTNAMVLAPPGVIAYQYGRGSFEKHRAAAARAGAELRCLRRPGLLFDVDTPEDLHRWRSDHRMRPVAAV